MKALGLRFYLVLSSPVLRTRQTTEIAAGVFDRMNLLEFSPHLAPAGDARAPVRPINDRHQDREAILLAGHEPYLSGMVSKRISGEQGLPLGFKKGSLCLLEAEKLNWGRRAPLCWLLTPVQFRAIKLKAVPTDCLFESRRSRPMPALASSPCQVKEA